MRILLVEDDAVLHGVIRSSLEEAGNRVDSAWSLGEASHIWSVQGYDAVVLDLNLPDGSGLTALRSARGRGDRSAVLVRPRATAPRSASPGSMPAPTTTSASPRAAELAARLRAAGASRPRGGGRRRSRQPALPAHRRPLLPDR
jgi:CheY-like chemotaxis protein